MSQMQRTMGAILFALILAIPTTLILMWFINTCEKVLIPLLPHIMFVVAFLVIATIIEYIDGKKNDQF